MERQPTLELDMRLPMFLQTDLPLLEHHLKRLEVTEARSIAKGVIRGRRLHAQEVAWRVCWIWTAPGPGKTGHSLGASVLYAKSIWNTP